MTIPTVRIPLQDNLPPMDRTVPTAMIQMDPRYADEMKEYNKYVSCMNHLKKARMEAYPLVFEAQKLSEDTLTNAVKKQALMILAQQRIYIAAHECFSLCANSYFLNRYCTYQKCQVDRFDALRERMFGTGNTHLLTHHGILGFFTYHYYTHKLKDQYRAEPRFR
jgi:hypothetical protein